MENSEFKELEYKYKADEVKLQNFIKLMTELQQNDHLINFINASSWDIYYVKENSQEEFQRFRQGTTPELTKKVKLKQSNNWSRVESDLPLDPKRVTEDKVKFHVGLDGYKENFRIFKNCFIYVFKDVNYVWYIVHDENMNEKGRFIEIEINKDKVESLGNSAFEVLKEHEQNLSKLEITAQNRLKKSLFELYRK